MRRILLSFNLHVATVLLAACATLALGAYFVQGYDDLWTCAICRVNRIHHVYAGHCWFTRFTESECTSWYREHVEPEHSHVWVHARATALKNLYGIRYGAMDRDPVGRTVWRLSPQDHIDIYSHAPTPQDGVKLALALASADFHSNNQDRALFNSLQLWKTTGYDRRLYPVLPERVQNQ